MTIQVMVENAIKHGIALLEKGGTIKIKTELKEKLNIYVSNHGQLKVNDGTGTGLKNVMERIKILYGSVPEFRLEQNGDFVMAHLTFPESK